MTPTPFEVQCHSFSVNTYPNVLHARLHEKDVSCWMRPEPSSVNLSFCKQDVTITNISENLFGENHEDFEQPVAANGKKKLH